MREWQLDKIKVLSVVFLILFFGLIVRLSYWQIIKGEELGMQAKSQYRSTQILKAPRGQIMAPDGSFWAIRSEVWRVIANPTKIKDDPSKIARVLSDDPVEKDRIVELLEKKDLVWVSLKEKLTLDEKRNIEAMGLVGISFESMESRFYPEASVAGQLLGFVGKNIEGENVGYFGLEGYYDLPLSGKSGFLGRETGAAGSPILLGNARQTEVVSGTELVTSLDKRIQITLYNKLKEGMEKYGAKGGSIIVMDPASGAILGMESYPSYDPGQYWEYGDLFFKNPAISDSFEPGSIFKVIVMSSALDAGVIEPDSKCDICDGPVKVDKYSIETWDRKYFPDSEMTDVIVHSDNVGMTFVGQKLGADVLYDYLDKFGIGKPTGIDLQGEASPGLRKKGTWNIVDLATASFGQGVATTPIQIVRAVSAIANDGILTTPRIVTTTQKEENVRVISAESADEITAMMAQAAKNGEAKWTNLRGFKVAGKTGTAQIPIAGHYDDEKTNASFIGFAPYDKPKFVMLVTLREPQSSPWASETAAPLWYSVAKDIFPYLGIHPE
ncbi:MAG: penicillin-binding protein 2 [Patescibacteria group bacterium]